MDFKNPKEMVIYSDSNLIVVNKPAGIPVIADGYTPEKSFVVKLLEPSFGRLFVVHRLDKETSGVVILARNSEIHRLLNTQFQNHTVRKEYICIVLGIPEWERIDLSRPLKINGDRKHRTIVDGQNGKPARTEFQRMEVFPSTALIQAVPHTGYTHQIRIHLTSLGYPILFDDLYSTEYSIKSTAQSILSLLPPEIPSGMYLHAQSITISDPESEKDLRFTVPPPEKWDQALNILRRNNLAL